MIKSYPLSRIVLSMLLLGLFCFIGCTKTEMPSPQDAKDEPTSYIDELARKEILDLGTMQIEIPEKWCELGVTTEGGFFYTNSGFITGETEIVEPGKIPVNVNNGANDEIIITGVTIIFRIVNIEISGQYDVSEVADNLIKAETLGMPPEIAQRERDKYQIDFQGEIDINGNMASLIEVSYLDPDYGVATYKDTTLYIPSAKKMLAAMVRFSRNYACTFTEEQTIEYEDSIIKAVSDGIESIRVVPVGS